MGLTYWLIVTLCVFAGLAVLWFYWRNVAAAREEEWLCEQIDLHELQAECAARAEIADMRSREEEWLCEQIDLHELQAIADMRFTYDRLVEEVRARAEASDRARAWLVKHLTPVQANDFSCTGCFNVRGGDTGTLYRITFGCSMNIIVLSADGMVTGQRMCFFPRGLSTFDVMLAQKVSLESNELATLRIAGRNFGPPLMRGECANPDRDGLRGQGQTLDPNRHAGIGAARSD